MDIWDITYKEVNRDNLDAVAQNGQMVRITRMVTFEYDVHISEILDGTDETDITLKALIEGEQGNKVKSVNMVYSDSVDIVDDAVISVEIA